MCSLAESGVRVLQIDPSVSLELQHFVPIKRIVSLPLLLQVLNNYGADAQDVCNLLQVLCHFGC